MRKFPVSHPIAIIPYQKHWPQDFEALKATLKTLLGPLALRIDHIGSTSVPGLAAKDIIDIQVTVHDLADPQLKTCLTELSQNANYRVRTDLRDELTGLPEDSPELQKSFIKTLPPQRDANIHIRQQGKLNQRYALLFCAFLRSHPAEREIYGLLKQRLAALFPESIEGYLYIKDPLMDLLYQQAENWAQQTQWSP